MRPLDILGPHRTGKPELRTVRERDRLVLVGEGADGNDRAEDLLANRAHRRCRVGQHRRVDEVSAELVDRAATARDRGAVGPGRLEMPAHRCELLVSRERTHLGGRIHRVADDDPAGPGDQSVDKRVGHVAMDDDPRARHAGLAGRGEHTADDPIGRGVEVGVVENDLRRFAAQLERDAGEVLGGGVRDQLADRGRAGEGDLVHAGMTDQRGSDLRSPAGEDVEHARRETRLLDKSGQRERAYGRIVARLRDHGAPGRQGRRELPRQQEQRRVPRHDRRDHTERLVAGVHEEVRLVSRDHLALDLVSKPGEVVEPLGQRRHLACHLAQQLAVVLGLQFRESVGVARDQVGQPAQQPTAVGRGVPAPLAVERAARRRDRLVDVGGSGVRDRGPRLAVEWVDRLIRTPGPGLRLASVDVHRELNGRRRHGPSPITSDGRAPPATVRSAAPTPPPETTR